MICVLISAGVDKFFHLASQGVLLSYFGASVYFLQNMWPQNRNASKHEEKIDDGGTARHVTTINTN